MAKEYACRQCKSLTAGKVCPVCHSTDLSAEWSGLIVVLNAAKSQVAQTVGIKVPGRYALRVV